MFKTCFFENIFYFLTVGGNPDYLYQHQLYHTLNKTCVRHETSKLVLDMGQWTTQIVPLAVKLWWAVMSFCFCSFLFLLESIPGTGISSDVWTLTQTRPHPALTNHHVCLLFVEIISLTVASGLDTSFETQGYISLLEQGNQREGIIIWFKFLKIFYHFNPLSSIDIWNFWYISIILKWLVT